MLLYFLLSLFFVLIPASPTPRCCMYDQWEGVLFFGFGSVGNDLLFSNGTARVSYDLVNAKTFVSFEIYQRSASSPISRTSAVVISHFKTGVKYTISTENRTCEKGSLSTTNMTTYCATDASNCMPLFAWGLLKAPGLGIAGGADFLDLKEGIKDPSVFTPPSYCPEQISGKEVDSWFLGLSNLFL